MSGAVFLSYASQDADAAERLCKALQSAGLEAWFDQSELRGGDAWDDKIRRQVRECALFIPMISANTQARPEGYFRREWKLAVERTHDMADHVPFLLPVVLDATPEGEAHVPAKFREVQWTRLPGGAIPPAFCERVKDILRTDSSVPATERRGTGPTPARRSSLARIVTIATAGLAVALGVAFWHPWTKPGATPAVLDPTGPAPPREGELLDRMWAIFDKGPDSTTEDWTLAQELGEQLIASDKLNADAWAAYSQVTLYGWAWAYQPVYDQALSRAQKAVSLSADSFEARFALAHAYEEKPETFDDAERMYRQLIRERPASGRVLRCLANLLESQGKLPEALAISKRATAAMPQDAYAWSKRALILKDSGRLAEAQEAVERALSLRHGPFELWAKATILTELEDDYPAAAAVLGQVPGSALKGQDNAFACGQFWLCDRQPEKALAVFEAFPNETIVVYPKTYFIGRALDLMERKDAAKVEWRLALKQVERQLAAQPDDVVGLTLKAALLAHLGENESAEQALHVARQFPAMSEGFAGYFTTTILTLIGRRDEAISEAIACWPKLAGGGFSGANSPLHWRGLFLHDAIFDPLRTDPKFQEFIRNISADSRFPLPHKSP
jgi:tetratricopeptide (TPR) repeat protein